MEQEYLVMLSPPKSGMKQLYKSRGFSLMPSRFNISIAKSINVFKIC